MRLSEPGDDVSGALGVDRRGLGLLGLDGPTGARVDTAPGLQGPGADLAQTWDQARRVEDLRDLLAPGERIQSRLQSAIKKERGPSWHGEQVRNLQY